MVKNHLIKYTYTWFIQQFQDAQERAKKIAQSVDEDTFLQKPTPKQWSAAECLEHLVSFGNIYYDIISGGLERAAVNRASRETMFKPRLQWRIVIRFFEPPYRIKLKTISSFEPQHETAFTRETILKSFSSLQDQFLRQLKESQQQGIDLGSEKVGNPALPFLKMKLSECYAVAEAHQRRHLWQAEQVLKSLQT